MASAHSLRNVFSVAVALTVLAGVAIARAPVLAAPTGSATSAATPADDTPDIGDSIVVTINIDMAGVNAPDNYLGSFTASLDWNAVVLQYVSHTGLPVDFTGVVNTADVGSGHIVFNGANAFGPTGNTIVLTTTFNVVGAGTSALDLGYSAMAAAESFTNLLPILTVMDGQVVASPAEHALSIAVDPVGGGTTDPGVGPHPYAENTVVDITATPAPGYEFGHWSGACTGTGACQVTMDADKSVTAHFTVTVVPPLDTNITAHPDDPSLSTDASFSFTSDPGGLTFECQLDGGGFAACSSPKVCTGLDYGAHIFEVRAINEGNPDPTPASYSWTIYRPVFLPLAMKG
jgi:hypothetical protein